MSTFFARDTHDPLSGGAYSFQSNTSTIRPNGAAAGPSGAAAPLNSRRLSSTTLASNNGTTNKPLVRPTPLPPRSIHSPGRSSTPTPNRAGSPPSFVANNNTNKGATRYPSPPLRAHSVMSGAGVRNNSGGGTGGGAAGGQQPHAQQHLEAPKEAELAQFKILCTALYYHKDAGAAQAVDAILNRLPAGSRTTYARAMATIRSQFHRDEEIRRRKSVEDALAASEPGRRVMDAIRVSEGGTAAMRSPRAKQERARLLAGFIQNHCLKGLPGTQPFFRGLYAALYLQGLKAEKGGAGKRRVEWEVDLAVFSEAGGGTWTEDSIDALKGILGCSEVVKEPPPESYFDEDDEDDGVGSPPFDTTETIIIPVSPEPLISPSFTPPSSTSPKNKREPPQVPPHRPTNGSLRERSISDPFLDPGDRRTPVANGPLSDPPASPGLSSPSAASTPFLDSSATSSVPTPSTPPQPPRSRRPSNQQTDTVAPPPPPQFRIFTFPSYLTDPELQSLCRMFPDFITSRVIKPNSNGTNNNSSKQKDDDGTASLGAAEEGSAGAATTMGGGTMGSGGHGEIRIGAATRDEGFRGTSWQRFVAWLRGIFGG